MRAVLASETHAAMIARIVQYLSAVRCTLPLWLGLLIYAVFLAGGNWLLITPQAAAVE